MKNIDEELKTLNMEEAEPKPDEDFGKAIEKAVNKRIKQIVFKTLAVVIGIILVITLCINPVMSIAFPNAEKMNEIPGGDGGDRVEKTELEKLISAYYEVSTPYTGIYTLTVENKGFSRYDISLYIQTPLVDNSGVYNDATLTMKFGRLEVKEDPYHLVNPFFGPYAWYDDNLADQDDEYEATSARSRVDELIAEIEALPESAYLYLTVKDFDVCDVDELREKMIGSMESTWVVVENDCEYEGGGTKYSAGLSISARGPVYGSEDMRDNLSAEELVKPYVENLKTLREHSKLFNDSRSLKLTLNNTIYENTANILDAMIEDAEDMEKIETYRYAIEGEKNDIIEYLQKENIAYAQVEHVEYSLFK